MWKYFSQTSFWTCVVGKMLWFNCIHEQHQIISKSDLIINSHYMLSTHTHIIINTVEFIF